MQAARMRNEAAAEVGGRRTIHGQFAAQAAATPDAAAVVWRGRSLSYAELGRRARALASRLRSSGVGPGAVFAVLVDRSLDLPVALLGILEAGGAWLLLDPAPPPGRLAQLLAAARPAAVLVQRSLARRLPPRVARVLVLEDAGTADTAEPAELANPGGPTAAENLACVLLDPGSGGAPRAVMVSHGNVAGFFGAIDRCLGTGAAGTWLAVSDATTDLSLLELLWTLCRGWRIVL